MPMKTYLAGITLEGKRVIIQNGKHSPKLWASRQFKALNSNNSNIRCWLDVVLEQWQMWNDKIEESL